MRSLRRSLCFACLLTPPCVLAAQSLPTSLGSAIPAINGRVVDAITGNPVSGIDVTLRAFASGNHDLLHYENSRTSPRGEFGFRSSHLEEFDMRSVGTYWLSVNMKYLSHEWMKLHWDRNGGPIDPDSDDLSSNFAMDPLFNRKVTQFGPASWTLPGSRVNS